MGFHSNSSSSSLDYESWRLAHTENEVNKTPQFLTLSASLHVALFLGMALLSAPLINEKTTETITIEIEEPKSFTIARGAPLQENQGSPTSIAKNVSLDGGDNVSSPVSYKEKSAPGKIFSKTTASAKPGKSSAAKTNFKAVPMTIDDIDAPALDAGSYSAKTVTASLNEDFDEDFDQVDSSHNFLIKEEQKNIEALATATEKEQEEDLKALDHSNKEEAAKLSALQNSLKKKNAAKIASALAAENAAQATPYGNGAAGGGSGGSGVSEGMPSGVRSLDQLRQMPGNPRPQYDREERRRGDQGEIAFVAYINKAGKPVQFRMVKSTGFRNLDGKTLAALKKWRFYPGQEGWVELPFRWDLKGGVQQDGGTLRRSVSQK